MSTTLIITILLGYSTLLLAVSHISSKNSDESSFFTANKKSPWLVVAFGMIGAAISGVTFVSLPGTVVNSEFHLGQFILGNIVGYIIIAYALIPIYYKLNLVSIYGYLKTRFGIYSNKTGAFIFMISQSFGAALRLLLAIKVLQILFFDRIGISLPFVAIIFLVLVWFYTYQSGIKTIVWTDMLQTASLVLAVIVTIFIILSKLDFSFSEMLFTDRAKSYTSFFEWEFNSPYNFWKQFISGILISLAMMGLDQNMMQKSLTCKSVKEAQKNVLIFSIATGIVQLLFLGLGLALYLYIDFANVELPSTLYKNGNIITDQIFPFLANNEFGLLASICFLIGITATSFSSVDSSLTSLTTSFTHDILDIKSKSRQSQKKLRFWIHIGFSVVLLSIVTGFSKIQGDVFSIIFKVAGYTYGPLLGIFILGITSKIIIKDNLVPWVSILSPIITYILSGYLLTQFGFDIGFLVILLNSIIFISILLIGSKLIKH